MYNRSKLHREFNKNINKNIQAKIQLGIVFLWLDRENNERGHFYFTCGIRFEGLVIVKMES